MVNDPRNIMIRIITQMRYTLLFILCLTAVPVFAQSHDWRQAYGSIPASCVKGGSEDDGRETSICRARYNGSFIGGKALDDRCYYNSGNSETSVSRFEVLIGVGYSWSRSSSTSRAVIAGGTSEENFYICRVFRTAAGFIRAGLKTAVVITHATTAVIRADNYEMLQSNRRGADLFSAASRGDYQEVRDALRDGQAVNGRDSNGRTALMLAAKDGYESIVRELISERADINAQDNDGNSALIFAAGNGKDDVVEQLFRAGADPHV